MKNFRLLFSYSLICFLLSACDNINPITGANKIKYDFPDKTIIKNTKGDKCIHDSTDKGINFLSDMEKAVLGVVSKDIDLSEEQKVGKKYHKEIMRHFSKVDDHRLEKLNSIFKRIMPYIERKELNFSIYLVESKEDPKMINAFTIPGGNIYFTTALMDFVASDDELAFIMGHEIGHNENKHTHRQLKRHNATETVFGEGKKDYADLFSLLIMSYGQPDEIEADRCGAYLAFKAGYDPEKGFDFFKRLSKNEGDKNMLLKLIRTHPCSKDRVSCGLKYIKAARVD